MHLSGSLPCGRDPFILPRIRGRDLCKRARGQPGTAFGGAAAIYIKHCFLGGAFYIMHKVIGTFIGLIRLCENAVIDVKRFG